MQLLQIRLGDRTQHTGMGNLIHSIGKGFRRSGGFVLLLRVSCFLSIALGILSLLFAAIGQPAGAAANLLVAPNDALGLIFTGFAVRMSRLEVHRRTVMIVVRTSRICLLLLGASVVTGVGIPEFLPAGAPAPASGSFGLAAGVCYLLISTILLVKRNFAGDKIHAALTAVVCTFLVSCWIALLLSKAELSTIPGILQIDVLPLVILSAICIVLSSTNRIPDMLKVLSVGGPEADAARILFPLAFVIPLTLAILRHRAESMVLLQPQLGLLLHVLLSTASMAVMIVWYANRIASATRNSQFTQAALEESDSQYRDILAVMPDPVWIFSAEGQLVFQNAASHRFLPPDRPLLMNANDFQYALGVVQQREILRAAVFGRRIAEIELCDRIAGTLRILDVKLLKAFHPKRTEPGCIVLVASLVRTAVSG